MENMRELNVEELENINGGDWQSWAGAAGGMRNGAAIGSMVGGVIDPLGGEAIGAGIGAIAGGIAGYEGVFASK